MPYMTLILQAKRSNTMAKTLATLSAAVSLLTLISSGVEANEAKAAEGKTGQIKIDYQLRLAGFTVGEAKLAQDTTTTSYKTRMSVKLAGLAAMFSSGAGQATATGRLGAASVAPSNYLLKVFKGDETETIRIAMAGGTAKLLEKTPEKPVDLEKIPVTEAHKRGATDPISAGIVMVKDGPQVSASACNHSPKIYDGHTRFDLIYSFDRIEKVDMPGYQGDGVVCKVKFVPVAGHHPQRQEELAGRNSQSEVLLVPVTGTRMLVPARIVVPTKMGTASATALRLNLDPKTTVAANTASED